ncbi:NADH-quinone oxidoreductase subunit C [Streptomyces sp. NPDC020379]|uniref:NADH-quinone oxidoreductase subunit C n=1 Tax=Streptomyces sp. NPDC020379 TaxID=3365071 RepID=UPI0037A7D1EC
MSEPTHQGEDAPKDAAAEPAPAAEAAAPPVGWLPQGAAELFGEGASAEEAYGLLTVDVPAAAWLTALETARTTLGCTFFDWLSAVDEPGTGFCVCAHLVALPGPDGGVRRLVLRTTVPHDKPALPTATGVYAGAAWHERETHEMFGVDFTGHPHLVPLLLPEAFEGHPLRKDFVLAARVAKAWPGAKEPGESEGGGPKRRQMLPPGVPDPNEWGPLKGQLPPAPARPARGARAAAAGDRPVRRARSVSEGSASQAPAEPAPPTDRPARRSRSVSEGSASQQAAGAAAESAPDRPARRGRSAADGSASQQAGTEEAPPTGPAPARRSRSASEGSASQQAAAAEAPPVADGPAGEQPGVAAPARRSRSASEGSASQQSGAGVPARRSRSAADGSASQQPSAPDGSASQGEPPRAPSTAPRSPDAPWHHARPAFEDDKTPPARAEAVPSAGAEPAPPARPAAAESAEAAPSAAAEPAPPAPAESAKPTPPAAAEPAPPEPPAAAEPVPPAAAETPDQPVREDQSAEDRSVDDRKPAPDARPETTEGGDVRE